MVDILSLERVWEDRNFFEIEVLAQSESVCAKARSYVTPEAILELSAALASFPQSENDRYYWECGTKGDESTPFVSLEFWCEDQLGHVLIEVYMEIDDGGSLCKHNCCFFIRTNVGELNSFGKRIRSLCKEGTGTIIVLNHNN